MPSPAAALVAGAAPLVLGAQPASAAPLPVTQMPVEQLGLLQKQAQLKEFRTRAEAAIKVRGANAELLLGPGCRAGRCKLQGADPPSAGFSSMESNKHFVCCEAIGLITPSQRASATAGGCDHRGRPPLCAPGAQRRRGLGPRDQDWRRQRLHRDPVSAWLRNPVV